MNKLFIVVILIWCHESQAQQRILFEKLSSKQRADNFFSQYAFSDAATHYLKALETSPNDDTIRLKLAESYRMSRDSRSAEKWYSQVSQNEQLLTSENKFNYANVLASVGKYKEAKNWYCLFLADSSHDARAVNAINAIDNLDSLYLDSSLYKIDSIHFNSRADDFSPTFYYGGIVFVSVRDRMSMTRQTLMGNKFNFYDLYFSDAAGKLGSKQLFGNRINSDWHEGPMIFFDDYTKIIFTCNNLSNGKKKKSKDGIVKMSLYYTEKVPGTQQWKSLVSLPFNNQEYSTAHPTISSKGDVLYFASDRPGGFGGADIYKSILVNGTWSAPENMGDGINTVGDEMFPFIEKDSVLHFASSGWGGLGGLDIFSFDLHSRKLKNAGYPINTSSDDFGYIVREDGKHGYLSSNRKANTTDDDIYRFTRIERKVVVKVYDMVTKLPLDSVATTVNKTGGFTRDDGEIQFILDPGSYHFGFTKNEYDSAYATSSSDTLTVWLRPNAFDITGIIRSKEDNLPIEGVRIELVNSETKDSLIAVTAKDGRYHFPLETHHSYTIAAEKKRCGNTTIDRTTQGLYKSKTLEGDMELICTGDIIQIKNIYYNLGKYDIRTDAAKELDSLVTVMELYPDMRIELRSHTDSRASAAYNMKLSTQRAQAVVDYVASKGILPSRMRARGMGETLPLNKCLDNVKCSEEEYQQNRRTEFKVLTIK